MQHWRTPSGSSSSPSGARRAILLIGGLIVAGVLAMHFLAPEPEHQTAAAPVATTR
jgi:hypothetical protein